MIRVMLAWSAFSLEHWLSGGAAGLDWPVPLLRLLLATILGGLVGLEREMRGRHAGFRTNLLVCLGCALAMIVSVSFAYQDWTHHSAVNVQVDPARIAYGVMAGIGFLGAGVIVKHGGGVHGLTTAAGLWCVAAIGLACGQGLYGVAILAAALELGALWFLTRVEKHLPKARFRTIVIRRDWHAGAVREAVELVGKHAGIEVGEVGYRRHGPGLNDVDIQLPLTAQNPAAYESVERELDGRAEYTVISVKSNP
jgi:putative Mg2+ transporter-C (MgtC) family protein